MPKGSKSNPVRNRECRRKQPKRNGMKVSEVVMVPSRSMMTSRLLGVSVKVIKGPMIYYLSNLSMLRLRLEET
jgi:hypothetical protein